MPHSRSKHRLANSLHPRHGKMGHRPNFSQDTQPVHGRGAEVAGKRGEYFRAPPPRGDFANAASLSSLDEADKHAGCSRRRRVVGTDTHSASITDDLARESLVSPKATPVKTMDLNS